MSSAAQVVKENSLGFAEGKQQEFYVNSCLPSVKKFTWPTLPSIISQS